MWNECSASLAGIMDCNAALARVEGDSELLSEMAGLFLGSCDSAVAAIRDALRRGDGPSAAIGAHGLKGSLASLEAPEARRIAGELEALSVCGEFLKASDACTRLAGAIARLRPVLEDVCRPAAGWGCSGGL